MPKMKRIKINALIPEDRKNNYTEVEQGLNEK